MDLRQLHEVGYIGAHERLATPGELFTALLKLSSLVKQGVTPLRLFVGQRLMHSKEAFQYRPQVWHRTLEHYINDVTIRIGPFGIIVNYVQQLSEVIGARIDRFLKSRGVTSGAVQADAFVGSYRRGFFGLHKDEFGVFTSPVLSTKRYFSWPFETFAHLPKAKRDECWNSEVPADYEHVRDDARVMTPSLGEYAYWPASRWHVVETSETVHASLSIGVRP